MAYGSTEIGNTHFAITTVNVPDRLDLRDMDDRKQEEDDSRRRRIDLASLRMWAPKMLLLAIVVGIVFFLFEAVDAWRGSMSASQLSQKLTASLGMPVQIESTQFSLSPTPRVILQKVEIDHQLVLGEVAVSTSTKHIAQGLQGRGWEWGEAEIAPQSISLLQGKTLLDLIPRLANTLPQSLSTIHFSGLEIADQPWLAGKWDVAMARGKSGAFESARAVQKRENAFLQIDLTPTAEQDAVNFQLEAKNWTLPVGLKFPVEIAVASGQAAFSHVDISTFSVGGPFGAIEGKVSTHRDRVWLLDASIHSEGIDLDSLARTLAPPKSGADATAETDAPAIQGTASFAGRALGSGKTLDEATATAIFEAPVHVRWPVLNGINLGYAATRPGATGGTSGGTTRFSSLEGVLVMGPKQVSLQDIRARAGAMATHGQVSMLDDQTLAGTLHVDMGATRVLAPLRVNVHGTLQKPEFGR